MTPLAEILIRRIRTTGPISLADYMAECLLHPVHGYYATRDPLGRDGDFITAPEISQMFGEMIGLAMVQSWMDQGSPPAFALVELGPGRGTLMADLLRAASVVPAFRAAADLHLVEASPVLRAAQARALPGWAPVWHDRLDDLPEMPLFLVANEFFDALPIRQFLRVEGGWRERQVIVDDDGRLAFALSAPARYEALARRHDETVPGMVVETCAPGQAIAAEVAARIAAFGGAALFIDYGNWRSRGDTFQAMRHHGFADPLAEPGLADLTAHVDFEALRLAMETVPGVAVWGPVSQGVFLERLGITQRAATLARNLGGAELDLHVAAHRRLTHPDEMGSLFQCLSATPAASLPFPGLEP